MAKYKITRKMMHKQLRFRGTLVRKVVPYYKTSTFRFFNKFLKLFVVKKEKTVSGIKIRSVYINRTLDNVNTNLRICIFSPAKGGKYDTVKGSLPCVVWFHGGGFGQGVPEVEYPFVKAFMETYPCIFVVPEYRLSTESKYPAALHDCYDALLYAKKHSDELFIRKNQIFVGGDSAGGGLACAVTIMARDRADVNIAFQMPLYPMLDDRMITDSSQNNDAPMWNTKSNECAWRLYLGDLYRTENLSCYAAPGRLADFNELPPAATYIGDIDPFYDETVDYFKNLQMAGIDTKIKAFDGCFHGFDGLCKKSVPARAAESFIKDAYVYAVNNYFRDN